MLMGMVPTRKPTGHISVNINPIRCGVMMTRRMRLIYLTYLSLFFTVCGTFSDIRLLSLFFLENRDVALCNKPIGQSHPHIALPKIEAIAMMIRIRNLKNIKNRQKLIIKYCL